MSSSKFQRNHHEMYEEPTEVSFKCHSKSSFEKETGKGTFKFIVSLRKNDNRGRVALHVGEKIKKRKNRVARCITMLYHKTRR